MAEVDEDAYRNKVLRTFFRHGRLTRIPTQLKKRLVILEKIVQEFEPEREVNQMLLEFHDDVAILRRELIHHELLEREQGIYRRVLERSAA